MVPSIAFIQTTWGAAGAATIDMLLSLLSLSCHRIGHGAQALTQLLQNLQVKEAAAMGRRRLERGQSRDASPVEEGALLGRTLLLIGQEELASDVFHQQLKAYDAVSRSMVRWHSALDQAWMFQHLRKPARAAACWAIVANDHDVPAPLRVEACCGLALSLQAQGQHASALVAAQRAQSLCESEEAAASLALYAAAIRLEILSRVELLHSEELSDHAFAEAAQELGRERLSGEALAAELRTLESTPGTPALLRARLGYLAGIHAGDPSGRQEAVAGFGRWLRQHGISGIDAEARVEGCLALLADRAIPAAREAIMPLAGGEREIEHHPLASDIQYCLSKIHMSEGRLGESLRQYKRHVAQAMRVVHHAHGLRHMALVLPQRLAETALAHVDFRQAVLDVRGQGVVFDLALAAGQRHDRFAGRRNGAVCQQGEAALDPGFRVDARDAMLAQPAPEAGNGFLAA